MFRSLADDEPGIGRYWTETTLCQFLELPEALHSGNVINQLVTNLAAFPFMNQAPSILTMEAMLRVITILTERYKQVLTRGHKDRQRLLFRSLAVFDRRAGEAFDDMKLEKTPSGADEEALVESVKGFSIDQPANDDLDEDDDDELAMAALDSLDAIQAISFGERQQVQHSFIPSDNFLHLVELLLLIAPLNAQERLGSFWDLLAENSHVDTIRQIANAILASFGVEKHPGVLYKPFKTVIPNSVPYLFNALNPLFEHFLFQKDFDLSKRKRELTENEAPTSPTSSPAQKATPQVPSTTPLLEKPGEILSRFTLTQLSFFIPPETLFGRLHPLFAGSTHGFSMGSFETQVFTWQAPTLLLVSGSILPSEPTDSRERTLADSLPPRRLASSAEAGNRVTYGAYVPVPWKQTHRACFGNESTLLFQLHPVHDVFRASTLSKNYVSYVKPASSDVHPGINFGTSLPAKSTHSSETVPLGPISLFLDDALEFGVFTHTAAGGGSFHPSVSPARSRGSGKGDWQDRFQIESLEVWGFGGEKEAERRKRNQDFEEREAKLRREGVLGKTGDYEMDKEILRMAGLMDHGSSGGSIQ